MTRINRRATLVGALSAFALASACDNSIGSRGGDVIDSRADAVVMQLEQQYPATRDLRANAAGMLVMPLITQAGFGVGGAWGRGALRINDTTVDYYSATEGSFGLQIGAQQYSHVLYFMTEEALSDFRASPGWVAGAGLELTVSTEGENLSADTITALDPVIAVVFGQAGFIAGVTIEGTKYNRIIP